jgi:hypothetical protein
MIVFDNLEGENKTKINKNKLNLIKCECVVKNICPKNDYPLS